MTCFTLPPSGNSVPAAFLLEGGADDFRAGFSAHCGFPENRILMTASGASALYVALQALAALNPRRRSVVIPAWCCPSVPQTILQAGLVPVLADLDPDTLGYEPMSLEKARRRQPLAVLLVHFFGIPQPLPPGKWTGTAFLRDCAQDFDYHQDPEDGADACFYSFGRGKALNSGHGGALCLPDSGPFLDACLSVLESLPVNRDRTMPKALAINLLSQPRLFWALTRLPFLGIGATIWHAPLSFAAMAQGFGPLGSACLEAYLQRKDFYRKLIGTYRALVRRCDPGLVATPSPSHAGLPTRFPLLVKDAALRESLYRGANARFGGVTRMYPETLPRMAGAPAWIGDGAEFPGAQSVADGILTLPVTAELMGREDRFEECLAGILEDGDAVRSAQLAHVSYPDRVPDPSLPSWLPSGP